KDSNFSTSTGDEAGSAGGGVASNKIKGKAEFVNFSFDVMVEGKNVARALDMMLHNDKNTPPFPVLQGPVIAMPNKEKPVCQICGKDLEGGAMLAITAMGMVSAVGRDAASSCASLRAGLTRSRGIQCFTVLDADEHELMPLLACPVHGITEGFQRLGTWVRLGAAALRDLLRSS